MMPAADGELPTCYVAASAPGTAPSSPDFSSWTFTHYNFHGTSLTESWTDGNGGVMHVEAFTRLPIQMTNTSTSGADTTMITWTDKVPNAEVFMVPSTMKCTPGPSQVTLVADAYSPFFNRRALGLACGPCKFLVGQIIGKGCSAGARALCLLTGELAPVCGIILSIICQGACTGAACAARICTTIRFC